MIVNGSHLDAETRAQLEAELRERKARGTSARLAAAMQSPLEPACIARAFASRRPGEMYFSLQVWIDLDAARSPLMLGRRPETAEDLDAAFRAFGLADWIEIEPTAAAGMMAAAVEAIAEGFHAALRMTSPESAASTGSDGFGTFAPLLAALLAAKVSLTEALALRVSAAHILLASDRRHAGWREAGVPYALRDLVQKAEGEAA